MANDSNQKKQYKNIIARRSRFMAMILRRIDDFVVSSRLVINNPRPNLRLARLNLRSTSILSVLSLYSLFLSMMSSFLGLPSFCLIILYRFPDRISYSSCCGKSDLRESFQDNILFAHDMLLQLLSIHLIHCMHQKTVFHLWPFPDHLQTNRVLHRILSEFWLFLFASASV